MKRLSLVVTALLSLLFVTSALAADAKDLVKLDEEWSKAASTKDVDKIGSFYAEDAMVYPPNMPLVSGRADAKKAWAGMLADPGMSISWKATHAEMHGDMGFTAGTYEASFKVDGKPMSEKGKYLCIWKKQKDGSWKAAQDIWNSDSK